MLANQAQRRAVANNRQSRRSASDNAPEGRVVQLFNLSRDQRKSVVAALNDRLAWHRDANQTLELPGLVHDVSWDAYEAFLEALGDHSLRHSYDRGTLELMSPRKDHDSPKTFFGSLVEMIAFTLRIPIQGCGSTTYGKQVARRGLEPDESYYVQNEARVRDKVTYDPQRDPPPDLVIEVDVTHSLVKRLPILAALGVPEVWRYGRKQLRFYGLSSGGQYEPIPRSHAFPIVTPEDLQRFIRQRGKVDDTTIIVRFHEWLIKRSHKKRKK
jgi:Uma2 family endonuclease